MKIIDYDVVISSSLEEFKKDVNAKINEGWKLQGGIFQGHATFLQAVIKEAGKVYCGPK